MKKNVVIEIPKNSKIKYEIVDGKVCVDRILYGSAAYPENYGYFENTLDWDGDALDAVIIADQSFLPGSIVPVRVIGAMKMIDDGETDTKIITVIDVDPRFANINCIDDLDQHKLLEIKDFFETYKNLQNKKVVIKGFEKIDYAKKEFIECENLFNQYKDLNKKDFIEKMKKEHPNKYQE